MIVRSKAPLRLGIAGGGSDVSPYSDEYGGSVLNASIKMYAYCTIELLNNKQGIIIEAKDISKNYKSKLSPNISLSDDLILHKAVYNRVVKDYNDNKPIPCKITTYSDSPPGSGLGSSSTLVVAILRAFQECLGLPLGEYDLAHLAYEIERGDCALIGGKQDQYAATFGGFNFMEFSAGDKVIVNPLRIRSRIINELESHLILYYTGLSRDSAKIIEDQQKLVNSKTQYDSRQAMHEVKKIAFYMKDALLTGNIIEMSNILKSSWEYKKKTSKSISNPFIDHIYDNAMKSGALSAKLSGAGGGGFLMIFVDPLRKCELENSLNSLSDIGNVMKVHFTKQGAEGWKA